MDPVLRIISDSTSVVSYSETYTHPSQCVLPMCAFLCAIRLDRLFFSVSHCIRIISL